jgi:hypothetical protein
VTNDVPVLLTIFPTSYDAVLVSEMSSKSPYVLTPEGQRQLNPQKYLDTIGCILSLVRCYEAGNTVLYVRKAKVSHTEGIEHVRNPTTFYM